MKLSMKDADAAALYPQEVNNAFLLELFMAARSKARCRRAPYG